MQNPTNTSYEQYEEPVNYVAAIIGAVLGGALAVAAWAGVVYFTNYIYYYLLIIVGALVAGGAILFSRNHNWKIGLIALLVTAVALVAGDYLQMLIALKSNSLEISDYIRIVQNSFGEGDAMTQYIMYLISLGMALFVGTFGNRSGAEVIASRGK